MRAVAYYRVSTDKQGRSGLGLDAQREAVKKALGDGFPPVAEFVEVESGKRADRPELQKALDAAKLYGVPLVVAKLDRLARNVRFLEDVLASGVEVIFCDMPQIQGAMGRFIVQSMAAVAQLEAGLISERTKAALAAAKARGTRLGGFRGVRVDTSLGTQARIQQADSFAAKTFPLIATYKAEGLSLPAIASRLNDAQVPTSRGAKWTSTAVKRVLDRQATGSEPRAY